MISPIFIASLPRLLHDAAVTDCHWSARSRRLTLKYECLRARHGGERIKSPVALTFTGVKALAIALDSYDTSVQPSKAILPRPFAIGRIARWHQWPHADGPSFRDTASLDEALSATRVDWTEGDPKLLMDSRIHTSIGEFSPRIEPHAGRVAANILIGASDLLVQSRGKALSFKQWNAEYANWWRNWEEGQEPEIPEPEVEPATRKRRPVTFDRGGPPTNEPAFDVGSTDLPLDLVKWARRAFERTYTKADKLRRSPPNPDAVENCQFARSVESWWREGRRAYIRIRGIDFDPATEDTPAECREAVWELALFRSTRGWKQRSWSYSYPAFGSAPKKPLNEKPWLKAWRGGPVRIHRHVWYRPKS